MDDIRYFAIPETLLKGLIEYLATRPYNEVGSALPKLMELKLIEQVKK
jgi:hypothetical protein